MRQGWGSSIRIDFVFIGLFPPERVRSLFRIEQRHAIFRNRVAVRGPFMPEIVLAERKYVSARIPLEGKRKFRILGERTPALRAFPPGNRHGHLAYAAFAHLEKEALTAAIANEAAAGGSAMRAFVSTVMTGFISSEPMLLRVVGIVMGHGFPWTIDSDLYIGRRGAADGPATSHTRSWLPLEAVENHL